MTKVPLPPGRAKHPHQYFRGKGLLPTALLLAAFGFGALQLLLHPAHDASLWSFPTVAPLLLSSTTRTTKSAILGSNRSGSDGSRAPPSSRWWEWEWGWWWERGRQGRGQGKDGPELLASEEEQHPSPPGKPGNSKAARRPAYHLVFSTSCGHQQDWESFVFFYHAFRVRQPGNVTRIASGCTAKEARGLYEFHRRFVAPMSPSFHVHFTPGYGRVHELLPRPDPNHPHKGPYKYMNKPFGLRHYMESSNRLAMNANQTSSPYDDDILLLLDPDMILLRPVVHDFSSATEEPLLWVEGDALPTERKMVRHGNPIAQQDPFLGNEWMNLPMPNFTKPPGAEGPKRWNSGPPYLATVRDMYRIVVLWTELAPRVLRMHDHLFAEMYGLIFAAHQLNLPFTLVKSFVVSETASRIREGWEYIDQLRDEDVCQPLSLISKPLPVTLHYCERYMLGRFFFTKYRVKKNILQCDKPLFRVPPADLFPRFDYGIEPPRADGVDQFNYTEERALVKGGPRQAKREAFMLCQLTRLMNEALRYFKSVACPEGSANLNETYTVYDDPTSW